MTTTAWTATHESTLRRCAKWRMAFHLRIRACNARTAAPSRVRQRGASPPPWSRWSCHARICGSADHQCRTWPIRASNRQRAVTSPPSDCGWRRQYGGPSAEPRHDDAQSSGADAVVPGWEPPPTLPPPRTCRDLASPTLWSIVRFMRTPDHSALLESGTLSVLVSYPLR